MNNTLIAALVAVSLTACSQSIPETTYINGNQAIVQMRATPNAEWELLMDGQIVARKSVNLLTYDDVLHGNYKGQPVTARMYLRSNGWVSHKVADIFVNGQLVETLVLS